jgi:hypothetical protein
MPSAFRGLARVVGDDLPVGEGVIDRAPHRAEVAPASGESTGAQASCRSGSAMWYFFTALSITPR